MAMTVSERQVLDALPIALYTVDLEGRITTANRAWSRLVRGDGAADESASRGTAIWEALSDLATRERVEHAMTLLRTGRAAVVTWEFAPPGAGEDRAFLMQVTPLLDEQSVEGFVFAAVDVTRSQHARESLADAGVAIAGAVDLDRAYQEVAQQVRGLVPGEALAIALLSEEDAKPRLAYQVGCGDDALMVERRFHASWTEALARGTTVRRTAPEGLELTAPMRGGDELIGAITVVADEIDAPERLDEAERALAGIAAHAGAAVARARLVRRRERARRFEAIGEISAGVAHELRNPLFGISSAAQLLRFRAKDDPVIEKNVGRVLREVERLNRMVTSLLEYGRPHPLQLAPADPDHVWDGVLQAERGRLESSALALQRTRAHPHARCAIDAEQLAQVFVNVLTNAIDAAPVASDLTVTSSVLASGAWRCRLHNAGPAVPPEALPRVFELFFSTKPGSAGIGLALCQRIVEEHGGTITLDSAPDRGTTVTIVLPGARSA
jgi:PAS domain S-box-containing protein